MKKTTILITIILLIGAAFLAGLAVGYWKNPGIKINAQELTCKDFKIGQFYIPTTEELKEEDMPMV